MLYYIMRYTHDVAWRHGSLLSYTGRIITPMITKITVERVATVKVIRAYDENDNLVKSFNHYTDVDRHSLLYTTARQCGMGVSNEVYIEHLPDGNQENAVGGDT